jgi:uncharacterized protein YigE (DUF2233 family)
MPSCDASNPTAASPKVTNAAITTTTVFVASSSRSRAPLRNRSSKHLVPECLYDKAQSRLFSEFGHALTALPRFLEGGAARLLFATNAGMFDSNLKPVGLYVEQGRELVRANTNSGRGNFHMKPNGIFYISAGKAAVAETQAFLKQRPQADLATQSGPMLVIDGRLHPRFERRPAEFGLVDPLDGRFYPIDRAARNRPERSAYPLGLQTRS